MSDFFTGVKQWEFDGRGQKFKLPLFYYDNTSVNAIFTGSTKCIKALLPHPDMKPIELYPGRCLVAFTAFEYRKTDIGPYNELSISFPISFRHQPIPGVTAATQMARHNDTTYVWQLPVTTEVARVGGVELYGYPKFLADISFELDGEHIRCELAEDGDKILSLEGKVVRTGRGKITRFTSYMVFDGIPLMANVLQNPLEFGQSRKREAARLSLGSEHPIATTLEGIGLSKHPIAYQFSPVNEAILFPARNMMG